MGIRGELIIVGKISGSTKLYASAQQKRALAAAGTTAGASFPIVGIGASAGGLAAFEAFFSGIPVDTNPGMAFVLVQHLAPDHKSMLSDIIQRFTSMRVFEVEDGMVVRPNCAYIIPPNRDMAFLNGRLQLSEPAAPRGHRMAIDFFFRSLAQALHERAIGIVLSGSGSDGTLGVRSIKGEGGMVMVQKPDSTEFDSMPRCAIATGLVDYVEAPADMPGQLIAYIAHAFGKLPRPDMLQKPKTENALNKIFLLLRGQTGHDFSHYKPSTINRRIDRRMAVHQIDALDDYVKYLQQTPIEVEMLFRDLLIGVTNFFRDPKAFEVLEQQVIPQLVDGIPPGAVIRVWSAGCSTGEEAYSLAMLLQERMDSLKQNNVVQIFATDIDSRAIAIARSGLYPASIAADVTPERLARFFTAEPDDSGYRIHKNIRDMLIFSEQDLIKDPPFSKLDLISCRNLLIYLGAELQKKLIPLFHYALKPGGFLLLGTSEGAGEFDAMFTALDRESKIYRRKEEFSGARHAALGGFINPTPKISTALVHGGGKALLPKKLALRDIAEQALLQYVAPPSALVNGDGDVLYLHGRTGMFLEPAPGVAGISNILKMAREGLRPGLAATLHNAVQMKQVVRCPALRLTTNGYAAMVELTVRPVPIAQKTAPDAFLYLVTLEAESVVQVSARQMEEYGGAGADAATRITELEQEVRVRDVYIQAIQEELESSTEELKSSNEEMQSVNEELQSTNEEMETSKEELQSVNEELATVNSELQTKVVDLSRANNDMNNLLAGTGIATIFVDHQLRILRFTPSASSIINLIMSDVGRPVGHLVSNLIGYGSLVADMQAVLNTLASKEVEVQTIEGRWYTMRIQPYRTLENVIEGVVISFVDNTETVRIRKALEIANEWSRLAVVVRDAHDAITMQDLGGAILAWNAGAERMYGWSEAEALQMNVCDRIPPVLGGEELAKIERLGSTEILEPYHTQRLAKDGSIVDISMVATALLNEAGKMYAISTTERTRDRRVIEQRRPA